MYMHKQDLAWNKLHKHNQPIDQQMLNSNDWNHLTVCK